MSTLHLARRARVGRDADASTRSITHGPVENYVLIAVLPGRHAIASPERQGYPQPAIARRHQDHLPVSRRMAGGWKRCASKVCVYPQRENDRCIVRRMTGRRGWFLSALEPQGSPARFVTGPDAQRRSAAHRARTQTMTIYKPIRHCVQRGRRRMKLARKVRSTTETSTTARRTFRPPPRAMAVDNRTSIPTHQRRIPLPRSIMG